MSASRFQSNLIFDFDAIKAQEQLPPNYTFQGKQNTSAVKQSRPPTRMPKIVSGPPKTLCLPHLLALDDISAALIVRQESPWDTYLPAITYDIAVALRKYQRQDAKRLIDRFGRLEHANILCVRECYIDGDFMFALGDDLPLTLAHIVSCAGLYPTEVQLGSILSQTLDGAWYLATSSLTHQSFSCCKILLGLDGIVKIACWDYCVDCTPGQAEAAYLAALPSITMRLMQKYEKEEGVAGVDYLRRWPVDSDAVGFLSATATTVSIRSLKEQPLVAAKHRPASDLVVLARTILLSSQVPCTYES
ncbi:hypothetical protein N7494_005361 [Penicillium frequentans]|uniref:Protein kinase domain-containing protein n=1 Tax=Penicillium frequentans TaxID=3151616 RepID=A0AAD6GHC9_9EURO|nr:hypothetical protein N7494_005361 [Penicillium glabrum]